MAVSGGDLELNARDMQINARLSAESNASFAMSRPVSDMFGLATISTKKRS